MSENVNKDRTAGVDAGSLLRGDDSSHLRNRMGGLISVVGLALALASLWLPWLVGPGISINGLDVPDVLDLRAVTPVNVLGLIGLFFFTILTVVSRLGIFAIVNAAIGILVLIAHSTFVWMLHGSTDSASPIFEAMPSGLSVSYAPYVAVVAFILVVVGSVIAARSAQYLMPDRAEGYALKQQ